MKEFSDWRDLQGTEVNLGGFLEEVSHHKEMKAFKVSPGGSLREHALLLAHTKPLKALSLGFIVRTHHLI